MITSGRKVGWEEKQVAFCCIDIQARQGRSEKGKQIGRGLYLLGTYFR
jgi:hypothetical protein